MKFLADANISQEMIRMVRDLGHDCAGSSIIPPRMEDIDVLRLATDDGRVVISADKDFGELVFLHRISAPGVVLIRVRLATESERVEREHSVWPIVVSHLPGSFLTITAKAVRARPLIDRRPRGGPKL